jgi:hypothetical protein
MIWLDRDPSLRSLYRFERACKGLDRFRECYGLSVYLLSLTLCDDQVDAVNKDLANSIHFLRMRFRRRQNVEQIAVADFEGGESVCTTAAGGLPFAYVWVVELQQKRYRTKGVKALHWHFAIAAPDGSLPDVKYVQGAPRGRKYELLQDGSVVKSADLGKAWGKGLWHCMRAYSSDVLGYLAKYFTKDYASIKGYKPEWANLRRWGSSQLGHFAYPKWAYEAVEECEGGAGTSLVRRRQRGRVSWYRKAWDFGYEPGSVVRRDQVVHSVKSPWRVVSDSVLT